MIVRLIQFFANNIVFTRKIRLCLYEMAINYISSLVFSALFSSQSDLVFYLFCFLYIKMYTLNIARAMRKMSVNELKDFIVENLKTIGFSKENNSYFYNKFFLNRDEDKAVSYTKNKSGFFIVIFIKLHKVFKIIVRQMIGSYLFKFSFVRNFHSEIWCGV